MRVVGPGARRRLLLRLLAATALLAASTTTAFLLPARRAPTTPTRLPAAADGGAGAREKKPLSWQESLELLISPTTSLAQRQVLLQVRVCMYVGMCTSRARKRLLPTEGLASSFDAHTHVHIHE